ncbi:carboxymuconolactone decarboxylase family protein [Staphylococcus caeli]|uniref:carboxymuconolactone decarboxylase family protein n=1 Tax=Staphylococcus caeli TaxID=2201815 RepID=UPI003F5562DE
MAIISLSPNGNTPFQQLLGHNNEIMTQWVKLSEILENDNCLSQSLKEEIRKMLAQKSGCQYCKTKGKPTKAMFNQKDSICIGFVEIYLKLGPQVPTHTIQILKSTLTSAEISELLAFISFTICQQNFGAMIDLQN